MAINLNPIKPYLTAIKAGAVMVLVLAAGIGGCKVGMKLEAADHADVVAGLNGTIAQKNQALVEAAAQLNAASNALREVNAETARLEREAAAAAAREAVAKREAARAAEQLQRRIEGFKKALDHARQNPDCNALLNTNLRQVCGI